MQTPAVSLLEVERLTTRLGSARTTVVDGVSMSVARGEAIGVVGESGSGKSMTAYSILGLLPDRMPQEIDGSVRFEGTELSGLSSRQLRAYRGGKIGMVFQDPQNFLDPMMKIGTQIDGALVAHDLGEDGRDRRARTVAMLARVGLPDPEQVANRFPHQLSGGQLQRVTIAAVLVLEPQVLIADEPTTALDVTVQAGILELLRELRDDLGLGVLLITHDLGVVAQVCDRVYVMYAGRVVETGPIEELFRRPRHPYTQGLLSSARREGVGAEQLFSLPGTAPSPDEMPAGCRFQDRCPIVAQRCRDEDPALMSRGVSSDACWFGDTTGGRDVWDDRDQVPEAPSDGPA